MPRFIRTFLVANLLLISNSILAADIHVAAGESIQKAIDGAPAGSVISIDAGLFKGSLVIGKAITLAGTGGIRRSFRPIRLRMSSVTMRRSTSPIRSSPRPIASGG